MNKYIDKAIELAIEYGPKIALAIVVLIVGFIIIRKVVKLTTKVMQKKNVDPSLQPFIRSLVNIGLKAMLLISVADMVGIGTTSFVALIGAAGLAIGFALQGPLANLAGGVLILIFKPYKVGDLIEAQGSLGVVKEIQIFVTILLTPENKTVIIPNGAISNGNVTNYTKENLIRVDLNVKVAYNSNIKKVKEILIDVMSKHPKVLQEPAPFVGIGELADNGMNLAVRPHCLPEHYWDVYFDIYENCKIALDENSIEIPYPQMDVHLEK